MWWCPAATTSGAWQIQKVFGNKAIKELSIPQFIDMYNHFMGSVDQANQLRSYYNMQRTHQKSWKALYHFLLNTTVINCYKLSTKSVPGHWPTHNTHKAFCKDLISALFEHSKRLTKPPGPVNTIEDADIYKAPAEEHRQRPIWLSNKQQSWVACVSANRKTTIKPKARKPFIKLLVNTIQKPHNSKEWARQRRPPKTKLGCPLCNIHLCAHGPCWQEHLN